MKMMHALSIAVMVMGFGSWEHLQASEESDAGKSKIAIVLTNHGELGNTGRSTGFYLSEATHPWKVFTEAGYDVEFLSPKGGKAPMDGTDVQDPINEKFLKNPDLVKLTENTKPLGNAEAENYKAVFFAGGHGTMWDFPDDPVLQKFAAEVYENGGVVAAVCHGPAALVNIQLSDGSYLVNGKEVTAFTNAEEAAVKLTEVVPFLLETRLKERGAKFTEAPNFQKHVAVSERLVTGQNPASATGVAEEVVKLIGK